MFRRRRQGAAEPDGELADEPTEVDDAFDDGVAGRSSDESAEPGPTEGPWDSADVPDDEVGRVDLGGLRVPVRADIEMQVQMAADGTVATVTLMQGASAMQVSAFAAPRRRGIWDEIRDEIASSIVGSGGSAEEAEGPFGTELHARVASDVPGQGRVLQPARFVGVDGPRWFLRGLFSGPAATDPVQAATLEELFRGVVVVRGGDAMAPREALPLRLPRDLTEAATAAADPDQRAGMDPPERGPEIAETR